MKANEQITVRVTSTVYHTAFGTERTAFLAEVMDGPDVLHTTERYATPQLARRAAEWWALENLGVRAN